MDNPVNPLSPISTPKSALDYLSGLKLPVAPSTNSLLSSFLDNLSFEKKGQYFRDQVIYIDDYIFTNCRFDRCKLVTLKGTFRFKHCVIDGSCIVEYGGEAKKLVTLFNSLTQYSDLYPMFKVTNNSDGTFNLE